jgi:hypothetical protein
MYGPSTLTWEKLILPVVLENSVGGGVAVGAGVGGAGGAAEADGAGDWAPA